MTQKNSFSCGGTRLPGLFCLFVLLGLAAGCSWFHRPPEAIVPAQQTAAEQYAYARNFQADRKAELITDDQKYEDARSVIIQTYEKVPEYFPDDRQFTPLAKLDVISMKCGFDGSHVEMSDREMKRTMRTSIEQLAELAKQYPEHQFVQAMSTFLSGLCYKQLQDYVKAQQCFKQVRDNYQNNSNDEIKRLSQQAAILYNQVYTQE